MLRVLRPASVLVTLVQHSPDCKRTWKGSEVFCCILCKDRAKIRNVCHVSISRSPLLSFSDSAGMEGSWTGDWQSNYVSLALFGQYVDLGACRFWPVSFHWRKKVALFVGFLNKGRKFVVVLQVIMLTEWLGRLISYRVCVCTHSLFWCHKLLMMHKYKPGCTLYIVNTMKVTIAHHTGFYFFMGPSVCASELMLDPPCYVGCWWCLKTWFWWR